MFEKPPTGYWIDLLCWPQTPRVGCWMPADQYREKRSVATFLTLQSSALMNCFLSCWAPHNSFPDPPSPFLLDKNNMWHVFFIPVGFQLIKRFIIKPVDFLLLCWPGLWESIFICNYEMNSISYPSEALKVIMNPLTQQTLQKAFSALDLF